MNNDSLKALEDFARGGPRTEDAVGEQPGDDPLPPPKDNRGVLRTPADYLAQEVHIEGGPLQIELRGWEVAKAGPGIVGWEVVSRWRPNEVARREAYLSALWLENRAHKRKQAVVYRVRPIISVDFDAMFGAPTQVPDEPETESPLVLSADEPVIHQADASVLGDEAPQVNWVLPVPGSE